MAEEEIPNEYQWTFQVKDVIDFEETTITVYSFTYAQAIKKVRNLKLPQLRSYESVEEKIKLTNVFEVNPYDEPEEEVEEEQPEDK